MCKLGNDLKLCTCSGKIDKSMPYWHLARKTIKQPIQSIHRMGTPIFPEMNSVGEVYETGKWLEDQLSKNDCFDFDYSPLDEDKLLIYFKNHKFEFIYSQTQQNWQYIEWQNPFEPPIKRSIQAKGYLMR